MGVYDTLKTNLTTKANAPKEPSLVDKALSFFGIGNSTPTPAPAATGSAVSNIRTKLGVAPQVAPAAKAPAPVIGDNGKPIDFANIPAPKVDLGLPSVFCNQKFVQNAKPASLTDIFKGAADIVTGIPKAIVMAELQPSQDEINLERAFNTDPNASNFEKVINFVPSVAAKGIFRFFQPMFQPYADDLAQAIVAPEFSKQVADGTMPYSAFQAAFPALDKSNAQVIGDSIQAGLTVFMPSIFGKGIASTLGTGVKGALSEGLVTGASAGGIFGTAQVLSSGSTDPAEIAKIYAQNIIGGALLGAVTHATIPIGREVLQKATKDITEKFGLPKTIYIDPQKVQAVFSKETRPTVDGIKVKISPAETDIVRSLGMTPEQYAKAAKEGARVAIPAEKIVQITDKPYFAQIKDTFGFKPSSKTITVKGEPHIVETPVEAPKPADVSRETPVETPAEVVPAEVKPTAENAPVEAPVKGEPVSNESIPKQYKEIESEVKTALSAIETQKKVVIPEAQQNMVIYRDAKDGNVHVLGQDAFEGTKDYSGALMAPPEKPTGKVLAVVNKDGTISPKLSGKGEKATPKKESGKQYPTIHEGGIVKMVDGEPVTMVAGVETFVHKGTGGFVVSEATTGRYLADGRTKEAAIAKAKANIKKVGEARFKKMLSENKIPKNKLPKAPKTPVVKTADTSEATAFAQAPDNSKTPLKPVKSDGEKITSELSAGVNRNAIEKKLTDGFQDLPTYNKVDMKEQANKAADLVSTNREQALRIAMGEEHPPEGLLPEAVFTAVEDQALANGDASTLRALATESALSGEATAMGQRIRALAEREDFSPIKAMQDVQRTREKSFEKKNGQSVKVAKKQVVKEIKASLKSTRATRQTIEEFIQSIQC